jgi:hypothetical protein
MSHRTLTLVFVLMLCYVAGCDDSFNPGAPFQPRMVVYSILTTDSDTQYVRVYSTYNPPENDPTRNQDDTSVQDAQVSITQEGGATFSFQAFTIERLDKSRYSSPIWAYRGFRFRPERGKTYTLNVSSTSSGAVTARTTVPNAASILPVNVDVLENPFFTSNDFGLKAGLSAQAKGYLARIYVDYLYPPGGGTYQVKRFEIPLKRDIINCYLDLYKETYPHPTQRSTPAIAPFTIYQREYKPEEQVPYLRIPYMNKIYNLYNREGLGILFKQAVFYIVQFDAALWNYYSVANMYQDKLSVRTDEPDYRNFKTGIGVFGSMTVDSLVWSLPEIISHPQITGKCQ